MNVINFVLRIKEYTIPKCFNTTQLKLRNGMKSKMK